MLKDKKSSFIREGFEFCSKFVRKKEKKKVWLSQSGHKDKRAYWNFAY